MKLTDRVKSYTADLLITILGAALYALSVDCFTAPNDIAPGGVTGLATLLNSLIHTPIGAVSLLLNTPLFIWGALESGKRFIVRTVIAVVIVSLMIDGFALFGLVYTGDRMIAAIFGGILSGAGLGLILLRGGSTGGTDIIARNLHRRFPYLSVGRIVFLSDAVVIILSAVVYSSIENALYAVITIFVSTKLIDTVIIGFSRDNGKLMMIVTSVPSSVRDTITIREDRGVTLLNARGGYSHLPLGVIMCAVRSHDVYRIKNAVLSVDDNAFIVIMTAGTIAGNGFQGNELN